MKALILKEYNKLAVEDVPIPVITPDEVLIRVKACGICGSDVHGMDGSTGRRRPPIIMGHEASGVIETVGDRVSAWEPGDAVTMDSTLYCGSCRFCRSGAVNLCDRRMVMGVSCEDYRQNGAFAEFVAVPARALYRLPADVPFEHAAMVEPVSIALHAVKRAGVSLNDSVLVVGAGMIGLLLVQALRLAGAGRIVVVDVAPDRLDMARKFGATNTVNSSGQNPLETLRSESDSGGFDQAFEAVGLSTTVDLCVRAVRKGGKVTLVGNLAAKVDFPLQIAVTRELTLFGSCASCGEYPACLDLMGRGQIRVATLISAVAGLDEGPSWFDRLYRREAGLMKVILAPGTVPAV